VWTGFTTTAPYTAPAQSARPNIDPADLVAVRNDQATEDRPAAHDGRQIRAPDLGKQAPVDVSCRDQDRRIRFGATR
jgi:hypothetical protein